MKTTNFLFSTPCSTCSDNFSFGMESITRHCHKLQFSNELANECSQWGAWLLPVSMACHLNYPVPPRDPSDFSYASLGWRKTVTEIFLKSKKAACLCGIWQSQLTRGHELWSGFFDLCLHIFINIPWMSIQGGDDLLLLISGRRNIFTQRDPHQVSSRRTTLKVQSNIHVENADNFVATDISPNLYFTFSLVNKFTLYISWLDAFRSNLS